MATAFGDREPLDCCTSFRDAQRCSGGVVSLFLLAAGVYGRLRSMADAGVSDTLPSVHVVRSDDCQTYS